MGLDMTSMSISPFRITAIKVSRSLNIPSTAHQLHNGNTFRLNKGKCDAEVVMNYTEVKADQAVSGLYSV